MAMTVSSLGVRSCGRYIMNRWMALAINRHVRTISSYIVTAGNKSIILPVKQTCKQLPRFLSAGRIPACSCIHDSVGYRSSSQQSAIPYVEVTEQNDSNCLHIKWLDTGDTQLYPYVWLRDVCRCPLCFHSGVQSRIASFSVIDPEVHPKSTSLTDSVVKVAWSDGHKSDYSVDWLRGFRFQASEIDFSLDPNVRFWGADVGETQLRYFEFDELLQDDRVLSDWLIDIQELGITVIKNTPRETGQLQRIGERVGFLRPCNYGPTFQVKSKIDASNAAYTSGSLPLHTDLAYYIWSPGIQLLHCIDQVTGTGGDNVLADGFKAAEEIKKHHPEYYNMLTSTVLEYYDIGTDHIGRYHQHSRHPVIRLDDGGRVAGIYWSDHGRHPMLRIPEADVQPFYRAMKAFHEILHRPENLFKYKMENGDILCFNNRRTLHGRDAFTVTETSNRHLEGGYLEWDEVNSKIRVLKKSLASDPDN